eukprot:GHVT01033337.1.p1 GENE.GHVT01033337.1~~GHVT01033337.1.p1  ORF type:complete len:205 (+),score=42.84 GHVT01033337.1:322-936(+)
MSPHDLLRITRYAKQQAELGLVTDLLPTLALLVLSRRLPAVSLSYLQLAVLAGMGLQRKSIDEISGEFRIPANQAMALLNKAMHKLNSYFHSLEEMAAASSLSAELDSTFTTQGGAALGGGTMPTASVATELHGAAMEESRRQETNKKEIVEKIKNDPALSVRTSNGTNFTITFLTIIQLKNYNQANIQRLSHTTHRKNEVRPH